jgi:N-acetylmuramoyl-L-alanine amidase
MGTYHTVVQGECLASISQQYNFLNYRTIYDAPENEDFRLKRPNPNIIYPGDRLYIPDKATRLESRPTGASHKFQVTGQKVTLRIVLMRDRLAPYAGAKYELTVGDKTLPGQTDGVGLLEQEVPADATAGTLKILLGDNESDGGIVWDLSLGYLDPADTVSGAQARLNNLGFYCGAVDGIIGPKTEVALRAFQIVNNLPVTAALNPATCGLLCGLHDTSS